MHLLRRQEIDAGALDKLTETDGTSRGSGDFLFSHYIGLARSCTAIYFLDQILLRPCDYSFPINSKPVCAVTHSPFPTEQYAV